MQTDSAIIAAIVGLVSATLTTLLASWIGYKKLKSELIAQHRSLLIDKQIEACEELWQTLKPFSFTNGDGRILLDPYEDPKIAMDTAQGIVEKMMNIFYSKAGLYFSKNLRNAFFELRDFMNEEIVTLSQGVSEVIISKSKVKAFRHKVSKLRVAIRAEIGVEDLSTAKEGPID